MKLTQRQRIINKLEADGEVSNLWAIDNYILRLGAIIHELRLLGWEFEGKFGKERGEEKHNWKNFYYRVIAKPDKPKPWQYEPVFVDGRQVGVRPIKV